MKLQGEDQGQHQSRPERRHGETDRGEDADTVVQWLARSKGPRDRERYPEHQRHQRPVADQRRARQRPLADQRADALVERERLAEVDGE